MLFLAAIDFHIVQCRVIAVVERAIAHVFYSGGDSADSIRAAATPVAPVTPTAPVGGLEGNVARVTALEMHVVGGRIVLASTQSRLKFQSEGSQVTRRRTELFHPPVTPSA